MSVVSLCRALGAFTLSSRVLTAPLFAPLALRSMVGGATLLRPQPVRFLTTTMPRPQNRTLWKQTDKYTVRPIGVKKTGGRDYTGKIRRRGIGGGHKQRYRMIDFQRLRFETGKEKGTQIEERVVQVRYDPC
ncbi:39S ribosomal protein L2, mitochondrial, partial [Tachysurus ichikawai]